VVEWSWKLLTEDERLLAERFSVFPAGGDPRLGFAAVCAGGEVTPGEADELLSSLVDKSLLQPLADGNAAADAGDDPRSTARKQLARRRRGSASCGGGTPAYYSALMSKAAPPPPDPRPAGLAAGAAGRPRQHRRGAALLVRTRGEAGEALSLAVSLAVMALLLGNDLEDGGMDRRGPSRCRGEAERGPCVTIAEALHVVASVMEPAATGTGAGGGGGVPTLTWFARP